MAGPLTGLKIIEFAGIGPGPFCAMLLSDIVRCVCAGLAQLPTAGRACAISPHGDAIVVGLSSGGIQVQLAYFLTQLSSVCHNT